MKKEARKKNVGLIYLNVGFGKLALYQKLLRAKRDIEERRCLFMTIYKPKLCAECGKEFVPKLSSQKYCCHTCSYAGKLRKQKEYWNNRITIDGVLYVKHKPKDYTRMRSIDNFAREHGISYGKAVAVLEGKMKVSGVSV